MVGTEPAATVPKWQAHRRWDASGRGFCWGYPLTFAFKMRSQCRKLLFAWVPGHFRERHRHSCGVLQIVGSTSIHVGCVVFGHCLREVARKDVLARCQFVTVWRAVILFPNRPGNDSEGLQESRQFRRWCLLAGIIPTAASYHHFQSTKVLLRVRDFRGYPLV
jgi:hypothetical protein